MTIISKICDNVEVIPTLEIYMEKIKGLKKNFNKGSFLEYYLQKDRLIALKSTKKSNL